MPTTLRRRFSQLDKRVRRRIAFFAVSLVLGTVCTLITWPGIFYTDSYGRWFLAENLAAGNLAVQDDWLSVPPQLFMAVLYKLTGSYASFTLVQSVLFFFTGFCAIDVFVPKGGLVAGILFAACPIFYGFAVYVEMSVGCVTALLWLLMLVLDFDHGGKWGPLKMAGYFLLCCFLYFCMLGFRQNAFTVLPVLAFVLWRICRRIKSWWPAILHGAAVALCFILVSALPAILNFGIRNGGGPMSVGFLWETVSMLGELRDKPEYADMLDYLGEAGTTQKAVESNIYESIYGYHQYIPNTVVGTGGHSKQILKDYLTLMTRETGTYLKVKGRFIGRALGITQPLSAGEYDYDRAGLMADYGFSDTAARRAFHQSYVGFQEALPIFRRPFILFIIAGLAIGLGWRALGAKNRYNVCVLYAAAAFFYAAFLVNTQSQEFRYFFAPLLLLYLCTAASLGALYGAARKAAKARKRRETIPEETS